MRAQRRSLDHQGEEELVLDERAVYHLQRVIAQRLLVLAPATVIHGCSLAQLVVVLAFCSVFELSKLHLQTIQGSFIFNDLDVAIGARHDVLALVFVPARAPGAAAAPACLLRVCTCRHPPPEDFR